MDPCTYLQTLSAVLEGLTALSSTSPADLPAATAAEVLPELARAAALLDVAVVSAAGRVDSSGLWAHDGARSGAAWIASRTGWSPGESAARVSAARLLAEHPSAWEEPWRSGRVRLAHLTALARAVGGPGTHKRRRRAALGAVATEVAQVAASLDAATFRTYLDQWCAQVDPLPMLESECDTGAGRYLSFSELGAEVLLDGRLPLAEGRALRAWCEAWVDSHHRRPSASPLGRRGSGAGDDAEPGGGDDAEPGGGDDAAPGGGRPALMADALVHLARLGEAGGGVPIVNGSVPQVLVVLPGSLVPGLPSVPAAVSGPRAPESGPPAAGTAGLSPPGSAPPWVGSSQTSRQRRGAPPGEPLTSRRDGPREGAGPVAAILGGWRPAPVSAEQARRHACGDAEVRRLIVDAGAVATELGRAVRIVPKDLRILLMLRDGCCRFPHCRVPAAASRAHHLVHWADGGGTDRGNLVCLCDAHHRMLHEGGFVMVGDPDAELAVYRPDGRLVGATRPVRAPGQPVCP